MTSRPLIVRHFVIALVLTVDARRAPWRKAPNTLLYSLLFPKASVAIMLYVDRDGNGSRNYSVLDPWLSRSAVEGLTSLLLVAFFLGLPCCCSRFGVTRNRLKSELGNGKTPMVDTIPVVYPVTTTRKRLRIML